MFDIVLEMCSEFKKKTLAFRLNECVLLLVSATVSPFSATEFFSMMQYNDTNPQQHAPFTPSYRKPFNSIQLF